MALEGQRLEELVGAERQQAKRIWESHGEALARLSVSEVRARVQEWMALLGATQCEANNVLALVEARLRDVARPADPPRKTRRERLFKTMMEDDLCG